MRELLILLFGLVLSGCMSSTTTINGCGNMVFIDMAKPVNTTPSLTANGNKVPLVP